MEAIGRVAFSAGWTLNETVSVIVGVAPNETTGTKNTNPPTNRMIQATTESRFANVTISLSRAGFEQEEQSPHRHPGPQRAQTHFEGSSWEIFTPSQSQPGECQSEVIRVTVP